MNDATAVSEEFLREVLEGADPNVLRLALLQLTGDPALAGMRVEKVLIWAGALYTYALAPEHHADVRRRAFDYLRAATASSGSTATSATSATPATPASPAPSRGEVRKIMENFGHGPLTDEQFAFAYEESAWDEHPREARWTRKPEAAELARQRVLVIGAGISGIAAAVQLERLGIPYTVIERQGDLGGTWNLNTYPGVRVDSTSLIYQYKFEKRYPWTEFFSSGGETQKYLRHCARKFGVFDKIVFRTEVKDATWDESAGRWQVTVAGPDGRTQTLSANYIISASGLFSTPKLPDIRGIESFAGEVFHTAKWPHDFELAGKRVALIGTGATGVQLMPHLAQAANSLAVFQRTPNWILPMEGYKAKIPPQMQWLFEHLPFYWNWYSYAMYFLNAQLEGLQTFDADWQRAGGAINERNDELRKTAEDFVRNKFAQRPDLIPKVLPTYPPMARRPTIDNGWYDALLQDNVALVTGGIREITARGIVDADGRLHEVDVIVCAAGFATTRYFWPVHYTGRDGETLERLWEKDGPKAYLGLALPGFPNLFTPFGPNSQGRSGSFYSVAEMWARYSLSAIVHTIESGHKSIAVRREAYERYNALIDAEAKKLLWETHGRGFYYVTAEGRSVVNSPWSGPQYHALLSRPDFGDFELR